MSDPEPTPVVADQAPIEADDVVADNSDADSAVGTGIIGSTASMTSSIAKFREEHGRTYHAYKEGKYNAPNDSTEQERLELQHILLLATFDNRMHCCPVADPKRVLDVGTGTGCWAIDYADEHPSCHVVGVDLSPIQPSFVPPNVEFQIDDLEDSWTFSAKFDLVYARILSGSFADWPKFFVQSFENLNPGGWVETVDILPPASDDGTLPPDSAYAKWAKLLVDGTTMVGRSMLEALKYREYMEAAGFQNITCVVKKWPQNRWPKDPKYKELGAMCLEDIHYGLEGLSDAIFTRVLGWPKAELDVFLADVRKDLKDTKMHAYWPIYTWYGQKPE